MHTEFWSNKYTLYTYYLLFTMSCDNICCIACLVKPWMAVCNQIWQPLLCIRWKCWRFKIDPIFNLFFRNFVGKLIFLEIKKEDMKFLKSRKKYLLFKIWNIWWFHLELPKYFYFSLPSDGIRWQKSTSTPTSPL